MSCSHCPTYTNHGSSLGESSIPLSKCHSFGFINGKLACELEAEGDKLPVGTYKNSCSDCHIRGVYLTCAACMYNNIEHKTQIDYRSCTHIGNLKGTLICEQNTDHADKNPTRITTPLPKGTYLSSCYGCSLIEHDTRLSCDRCSYGKGRWRRAWIDVMHCDAFSNNEGTLTCSHLTSYDGNKEEVDATECDQNQIEKENTKVAKEIVEIVKGEPRIRSTKIAPLKKGMPTGTFWQSCAGCSIAKDIETNLPSRLLCSFCWGEDNNGKSSVSLLGCHSFGNHRGHLVCAEKKYKDNEKLEL